MSKLDHLVVAVDDLEQSIDAFAAATGVRPVVGGRHEGLGTWNALVALGDDVYLELLAKDPTRESIECSSWLGVADCTSGLGRLTTYCVRVSPDKVDDRFRSCSRKKNDGSILEWQLDVASHAYPHVAQLPNMGTSPFRINWCQSEHPALTAPKGCSLISLEIMASLPDGSQVAELIYGDGKLFEGTAFSPKLPSDCDDLRLRATLRTCKGEVVIQ
ncbi:hypothetical protein FOL47_010642 [Perkinsus chesapeaki]|uniref:Glyoxalase-like domain-containing protein n=1 Tax=Perkinsus chesapeaki TaxID=330153 RepID=A0A7J6L1C1_PERCH|nr:hypothetical protein FOL47_010642 [Perkinsus chesapeaki]